MSRILWVGDSPLVPTGFGQVTRNVCEYLHNRGHDVRVFGVHSSEPVDNCPYPIYPATSEYDLCGFSRIANYVRETQPEVLWLFGDVWVVGFWRQLTKGSEIPTVVYTPVDGEGYSAHPEWGEALEGCHVYTMTEFGQKQLEAAGVPSVGIIPHGADHRVFQPDFPNRQKFNLDPQAFVVLNANRNQPRKRIDLTLQGFCQFAANLSETANVKLWLHMGLRDHGWEVIRCFNYWANHYRLPQDKKYLYLTHSKPWHPNVPVETLAEIYRCADVVVNTSLGEGWGLVAHESALCGVAQLVPNNSASAELWEGHAALIQCKALAQDPGSGLIYRVPSAASVAEQLTILYYHQEHRERLGHLARARALEYTWEKVLPRFEQAIREAVWVSS